MLFGSHCSTCTERLQLPEHGEGIKTSVKKEVTDEWLRVPHPESNLLHGEGWLFEIASAEHLRKKGYAPFVTFGTVFDAAKADIVAVPKPNSRVKWDQNHPTVRKLQRASRHRKLSPKCSKTPNFA